MHFRKPALTPQQQLDHLIARGLQVRDVDRALRLLEVTSYFRLIPYMRPFQDSISDGRRFRSGTGLDQIYSLYQFDSQLRQLAMAAVERVEVAVRAAISNHMAPIYGTHWYLERKRFNDRYRHEKLINNLHTQIEKEREKFSRERRQIENSRASPRRQAQLIDSRKRDNYVRFYAETYTEPALPPSWAMAEELSLGGISHLYSGLARDWDRKQIAHYFQVPQRVLGSWLHTLTFIRNICAHHARLWNRELAVPPRWDRSLPEPDGSPGPHPPRRFMTVAAMLVYLSWQVSPDTRWLESLIALINEYPDIPREPMGFPQDWQTRLRAYQE
ncbi:MAG: Abi family protein [Xanthomonadales bacterium]|nr:Abi family protein [Xanthomonadales bacterium]